MGKVKNTHKAIFEVEFDKGFMIDDDTLKEEFDGDMTKAIKFLYEGDGMGIFDDNPKLVRVEKLLKKLKAGHKDVKKRNGKFVKKEK